MVGDKVRETAMSTTDITRMKMETDPMIMMMILRCLGGMPPISSSSCSSSSSFCCWGAGRNPCAPVRRRQWSPGAGDQAGPGPPVAVVVVVVVQVGLLIRVEVRRSAAAVAGPATAVTRARPVARGAGPPAVADAAVAGAAAAGAGPPLVVVASHAAVGGPARRGMTGAGVAGTPAGERGRGGVRCPDRKPSSPGGGSCRTCPAGVPTVGTQRIWGQWQQVVFREWVLAERAIRRPLAFAVAGDQENDSVVQLLLSSDAGFSDFDYWRRFGAVHVRYRSAVFFCVVCDGRDLGVTRTWLWIIHGSRSSLYFLAEDLSVGLCKESCVNH
ncbi:hypothetical protein CEXT_475531 [Caerostris extrusa]|uniref:Uncharacterized protein n=1 Tax=Caerostris extrusa TaxID=172846 RepID=A0AAV4XDX4_CAEEX|nr:hypothetical protein CEXT_475531 [Caerostris extrusa]